MFLVNICVLFIYNGTMKSVNMKKEKCGAFDVIVFTNTSITGLYFIYNRQVKMRPTIEHKTTLHGFIIHGMNQKFNQFFGLISIFVWPNMKKIGGNMVKNYRFVIDFTINIDEKIKSQGNYNVRQQFIDNYPSMIDYFQANPPVYVLKLHCFWLRLVGDF
jgi:hypothetical protein